MNLMRHNPLALSSYRPRPFDEQLGRAVESMFEDMLAPFSAGPGLGAWQQDGVAIPRLNVRETEKEFQIEAEMPGVKKDDVKLAIENQRVTIEGECETTQEQRDGDRFVCAERSARRFLRSFALPADVDETAAEARMENGVLKVTLPKKQGSAATRIAIQ